MCKYLYLCICCAYGIRLNDLNGICISQILNLNRQYAIAASLAKCVWIVPLSADDWLKFWWLLLVHKAQNGLLSPRTVCSDNGPSNIFPQGTLKWITNPPSTSNHCPCRSMNPRLLTINNGERYNFLLVRPYFCVIGKSREANKRKMLFIEEKFIEIPILFTAWRQ